MITLRKAERKQAKLRIGLSGPSGSGKTYSALLMARGLTSTWDKIAMIDTENGSGELYSNLGAYNVVTLTAPFTPEKYIEAIKACESAGMEVIVIDSATHEWDGKGGCLEIQESLGGRYQDWAKVTPRHQKFIQSILESGSHVIATTRRKQDYEMTRDGNGSVKVQKVGLKEVQREGFEYELTLSLEIDTRHNARASKDRTGLFADKPDFTINEETGKKLKVWAEAGTPAIDYDKLVADIKLELERLEVPAKTKDEAKESIKRLTGLDYTKENCQEILNKLKESNKIVEEVIIASEESFLTEEELAQETMENLELETGDKLTKALNKK